MKKHGRGESGEAAEAAVVVYCPYQAYIVGRASGIQAQLNLDLVKLRGKIEVRLIGKSKPGCGKKTRMIWHENWLVVGSSASVLETRRRRKMPLTRRKKRRRPVGAANLEDSGPVG